MSFKVAIQEAPSRRGLIGTPSAWSVSGPVPTTSGVYTGGKNKTYTLTYDGAGGDPGNNANLPITWADGEGNTGRINLGTDHGYANGDVYLHDGISLAYAASAIGAGPGNTQTIAVTAANRQTGTPVIVSGDAAPTDVSIEGFTKGTTDLRERTFDGRERRLAKATTGALRITTDYLDDANSDKLLYLHDKRRHVCVAENYDEFTEFLWHGAGLMPFIGPRPTYTRSQIGTYTDPRTGLVRSAGVHVPRIVAGPAGRGFVFEKTGVNLFTASAAKSGTLFWNAAGTHSTATWDTNVKPPIDTEDDYWDGDYTGGVLRCDCTTARDSSDFYHLNTDAGVAATTIYTGSLWLMGKGEVKFSVRAGVSAADTTIAGPLTIELSSTWTRYELSGTTGGSDTKGDLLVVPSEGGVCYMWGWQIEPSDYATNLIQTTSGAGARVADAMEFAQPIPVAGSLAISFFWAGGTLAYGTSTSLITATGLAGNEKFLLEYFHHVSSPLFKLHTQASDSGDQAPAAFLAQDTWHHLVATWGPLADDRLNIVLYHNGVLLGNVEAVEWEASFGTGFNIMSVVEHGRVEEVRIDNRVWTAAQALEQYERMTDDEWVHIRRRHAGRKYAIEGVQESWLSIAIPDKIIAQLDLVEVDREDDSVLVDP